jgi:transposase InsO family protein
VTPKEHINEKERRALTRHAAVSWIQQCRQEGHPFGSCLRRAACLEWQGRCYSARTLEEWYYAHQAHGFAGLEGRPRSDCGRRRALAPELAQAIVDLRKSHPGLTVTALLARLRAQGVLEAGGGCSRSTVYRFLHQQGLDRQRLRALSNEVGGPTKAWETAAPNALWMADVMDGPTLKAEGKGPAQRTWLVATLDDHSRLCPHAQFYPHQKLPALLDCLRQSFSRRGLPEALYTDQGKIFTGSQLKLVCANLGIRLVHAKPYAAWSKGKSERFFRTLQEGFLSELKFEPAHELDQLNGRLWDWLENRYHPRAHSALEGQSPRQRFAAARLRPLPENWRALFCQRISRRVRLDATVSLESQLWEVPVHLRGRQVELRRDPFEPTRIEVWCQGSLCGLATRCDKTLNAQFSSNHYEARRR